jgi:hypothetical protein
MCSVAQRKGGDISIILGCTEEGRQRLHRAEEKLHVCVSRSMEERRMPRCCPSAGRRNSCRLYVSSLMEEQ